MVLHGDMHGAQDAVGDIGRARDEQKVAPGSSCFGHSRFPLEILPQYCLGLVSARENRVLASALLAGNPFRA